MNEKEMISFCNYFYNSANIPIRIYMQQKLTLSLPFFEKIYDPFTLYYPELCSQSQTVTFFTTKQFIYYGIVKNSSEPDLCITIGPITNTVCSNHTIKEILKDADISLTYIAQFTELFTMIPLLSFDRFLHTLCFINFAVNGTALSPDDIWNYKDHGFLLPIAVKHIENIYDAKEKKQLHNSYHFEKQYLNMVENGDYFSLKKLFDKPVMITPGTLASTMLRQNKNIFIACATLVTRTAIEGGLDPEEAYHLSDIYIQQMENLQTHESIYNLQYQMIIDFTERVAAAKVPEGITPLIYECMQFVSIHSNQPITVSDVARHVNRSRSYVSRKFKQELGLGLNEFITRKKLEEAKSLLAYSDKTISEISSYLCFSSQSYFQNVFKKVIGITPKGYRLKMEFEAGIEDYRIP